MQQVPIVCAGGGNCYEQWSGLGLHPNVDHAGPNVQILTPGFQPWQQMPSTFMDFNGLLFNPFQNLQQAPAPAAPAPRCPQPTLDCATMKCTDGSEPGVSDAIRLRMACFFEWIQPCSSARLCDGRPIGAPPENVDENGNWGTSSGAGGGPGTDTFGIASALGIGSETLAKWDPDVLLKKVAYVFVGLILVYLGAKAVTE